jgi:hypothetical protein
MNPSRSARYFTATAIRLLAVAAACVLAFGAAGVTHASAATYHRDRIITDYNMRASYSMSEAEIQSFLEARPGALDSLTTTDHVGTKMKASKIIYQATQNFNISPRVILVMLQKEQSLLTAKDPSRHTLSRALGAGCFDGKNLYPGFGKQVWFASWLLNQYGEIKAYPTTYVSLWTTGMAVPCYTGTVIPLNLATYKLYTYNPSFDGNKNFWTIHENYFGDPLAAFHPAKVSVTVASKGYETIKVDWSSVSGATGYAVYRATSSDGPFTRIATVTEAGSSAYTDTGRTTGKTYYYRSRAYHTEKHNTYGSYSSVKSTKAVPNKVTGLVLSKAASTSIGVAWSAVDGATGYRVYRATSSNGSYKRIKTTSLTHYTDTHQSKGKAYYYKVRAYHTQSSSMVFGSYSTVLHKTL